MNRPTAIMMGAVLVILLLCIAAGCSGTSSGSTTTAVSKATEKTVTTTAQQTWKPVVTGVKTTTISQQNSDTSVSASQQDIREELLLRTWYTNYLFWAMEYSHRKDIPIERKDPEALVQVARDQKAFYKSSRTELVAIPAHSNSNQILKNALLKLIDEGELAADYDQKAWEAVIVDDLNTAQYYMDKYSAQVDVYARQSDYINSL